MSWPETTRFGRQDAEVDQDVCLAGLSIKKEHCIFVRDGSGKIVVNPMAGAKVTQGAVICICFPLCQQRLLLRCMSMGLSLKAINS